MHQTKIRPATEPYDIWCARRKIQNKEVKIYLRGRVFHRGGTYVMPNCPICGYKEKHCTCLDVIEEKA